MLLSRTLGDLAGSSMVGEMSLQFGKPGDGMHPDGSPMDEGLIYVVNNRHGDRKSPIPGVLGLWDPFQNGLNGL